MGRVGRGTWECSGEEGGGYESTHALGYVLYATKMAINIQRDL